MKPENQRQTEQRQVPKNTDGQMAKPSNDEKNPPHQLSLSTLTSLATIGSLLVAIAYFVWYFHYTERTDQASRQSQIEAARIKRSADQTRVLYDLTTQFNANPLFTKIRKSIDQCKRVYDGDVGLDFPKGSKGKYSWDQINQYLNFFERVGFLVEQKQLTPEMANESFGAAIIEASEYKELNRYVLQMQASGEPQAFKEFQWIADKLASEPDNLKLTKEAQKCNQCCVPVLRVPSVKAGT